MYPILLVFAVGTGDILARIVEETTSGAKHVALTLMQAKDAGITELMLAELYRGTEMAEEQEVAARMEGEVNPNLEDLLIRDADPTQGAGDLIAERVQGINR